MAGAARFANPALHVALIGRERQRHGGGQGLDGRGGCPGAEAQAVDDDGDARALEGRDRRGIGRHGRTPVGADLRQRSLRSLLDQGGIGDEVAAGKHGLAHSRRDELGRKRHWRRAGARGRLRGCCRRCRDGGCDHGHLLRHFAMRRDGDIEPGDRLAVGGVAKSRDGGQAGRDG